MAWALQDAKARLSEVIKRAQTEGPQEVTVRGEPLAVLVSKKEFEALKAAKGQKPKKTFAQHLLEGPPWPDDFVEEIINRPKDYGRDIEF